VGLVNQIFSWDSRVGEKLEFFIKIEESKKFSVFSGFFAFL
jgi:hypothetical protein